MAITDRHVANAMNVEVNYLGFISAQQQQDQINRQLQHDREKKAAMIADGLEFPGSFNKWDDPKIRKLVNSKVSEIGTYINENPDLFSNPAKLIEFDRLKSTLIRNPDVERAMRVQKEHDTWQKWTQSKEYAHWQKTPEAEAIKAAWDNYANYGDMGGLGESKGEFKFFNPGLKVDTEDIFIKLGKAVKLRGQRTIGDYTEFYAKDEDILLAAGSFMNDVGVGGNTAKDEFNAAVKNGEFKENEYKEFLRSRISAYTRTEYKVDPSAYTRKSGDGDKVPQPIDSAFKKFMTNTVATSPIISDVINPKWVNNGKLTTETTGFMLPDKFGNLVTYDESTGMQFQMLGDGNGRQKLMIHPYIEKMAKDELGYDANQIRAMKDINNPEGQNLIANLYDLASQNYGEKNIDRYRIIAKPMRIAIPTDDDNPYFSEALIESFDKPTDGRRKLVFDDTVMSEGGGIWDSWKIPEDSKNNSWKEINHDFGDGSETAISGIVYMPYTWNDIDQTAVDKGQAHSRTDIGFGLGSEDSSDVEYRQDNQGNVYARFPNGQILKKDSQGNSYIRQNNQWVPYQQ